MQFKECQTEQKLRGGYYTPLDISVFVSRWVVAGSSPKRILEPSCGDGAFIDALGQATKKKIDLLAFEIEDDELRKANSRFSFYKNIKGTIHNTDFLEWFCANSNAIESFDGVVGNPPFIRYQYLAPNSQVLAEKIFEKYQLPFTKHTNAWVPFIIASLALLKPGGRLGMVIPSEILHVLHAQSLRDFIKATCSRAIIFDPEDIWFENTLQGAVILFAEKKKGSNEKNKGIGIVRTCGRDFLSKNPETLVDSTVLVNGSAISGKWTRALLTRKELGVLDSFAANENVHPFTDLASVDVGVVTGANNFFLVPDDVVTEYALKKWAHPMFGRSAHCPGVIYNRAQHQENIKQGLPTNFIWFNISDKSALDKNAKRYVEMGEHQNLHTRYKCRVRSPWFRVPSVYTSRIGMLKRANAIPRLILNKLEAYTTDTAYRITPIGINEEQLVFNFINSLTALSAELEGRSYGGGVLELVPSEIEKLLIPVPKTPRVNLGALDKEIQTKSTEEVLRKQDLNILASLGASKSESDVLFDAWRRLCKRRQRLKEPLSQSQE